MYALACARQTEQDLKKERGKNKKRENEGVGGRGRPGRGTDARTPQAHLPMPHFPLCGFLAWHIDINNNAPGGCRFFLLLFLRSFSPECDY